MFDAINPMAIAKKEALKPDFNHNGKPDLIEALDAGEAACDKFGRILSHFDAQDVREILDKLPARAKAKVPVDLINEACESVQHIPAGLAAAKIVMEHVEAELLKR